MLQPSGGTHESTIKTVIIIKTPVAFEVNQRIVRYPAQVGSFESIVVKGNPAGDKLEINDVGPQFRHLVCILEITVLYGGVSRRIGK